MTNSRTLTKREREETLNQALKQMQDLTERVYLLERAVRQLMEDRGNSK